MLSVECLRKVLTHDMEPVAVLPATALHRLLVMAKVMEDQYMGVMVEGVELPILLQHLGNMGSNM